ncbi:glycosyltransferase family 4 protein [Methylomonas sp. YC3]
MRVLIIHNRYQQSGGEDNVVNAEAKLLTDRGHDIELWIADNKDLPGGLIGRFSTAINTTYSKISRDKSREKLRQFKPDLVHVHNFFPQFSPSIYDACQEYKVPVVQTLHNYRLICPGAMLMRGGNICELCVSGSPYQAALYDCYRNSKLGSLVVANLVAYHRRNGTWHNKVDRFIALTNFAKRKFVEAGFPDNKIAVKGNFMSDPLLEVPANYNGRDSLFALFVGRLSEEKGISTLLNAWTLLNGNTPLKVAGVGPLESLLHDKGNVVALGYQDSREVSFLMRQAAFLVLPSEWYEGFPLVLVEAFAHGLPVLASNMGSMADIITDGETGLLFTPGSAVEIAQKAQWLLENPKEAQKIGANARRTFLEKYTAEKNYAELIAIYQDACSYVSCS